MSGRIARDLGLSVGKKPPDPKSSAWEKLVRQIMAGATPLRGHKMPRILCCVSGGKRKDGWPCESPYVRENGRCKMHGGNVLRGAAHPAFIHGRSSKVLRSLPQRLREGFTASVEDEDLLSLRVDIALSDTRLNELVERLDTGETGDSWQAVADLGSELTEALSTDAVDVNELLRISTQLTRLASTSIDDQTAWRELKSTSQHRRRLVDTERKRLKDLHAYLTAEEAMAIIARLTDTIIRHVDDRSALNAILTEVQQIAGDDPKAIVA